MALSINAHSLLTTASAASTTGTLTASVGDLAICAILTSTSVAPGTVTGGGLTWVLALDQSQSTNHTFIYIAPVYATVTAQTITVSITGATVIKGALFAATNAGGIAAVNLGSSVGTATMTRTTITTNNGSLVVAIFNGTTDTVISAGATQLDNNGANIASASANSSPFLAGSSVAITATSAGGNLALSTAFEITSGHPTALNNYQFVKVGDGMSVGEKIR